jgi:hypothetical protein
VAPTGARRKYANRGGRAEYLCFLNVSLTALSVSALSAFAVTTDKQCKGGNPNCQLQGPGESENGPAVNGGNPNITDEFQGGRGHR